MSLPDRPANPVFNAAATYAANVVDLCDFRNGSGNTASALVGRNLQIGILGGEGATFVWLSGVLGGRAVRRQTFPDVSPARIFFAGPSVANVRDQGTLLFVLRKHTAGSAAFYHTGLLMSQWNLFAGQAMMRITDAEVELRHRGTASTVVSALPDVIPLHEWVTYILTWQISPVPRMQLFWLHPTLGKRTVTRSSPSAGNNIIIHPTRTEAVASGFLGGSGAEADVPLLDIAYFLRLDCVLAVGDEDALLADPFLHLLAGDAVGATGPDALVPRLTGQHLGDNGQANSIGGIVVPAEALALRAVVDAGIPGLVVTAVSGACGEGDAAVQGVAADQVQLVTPDGNAGEPVELLVDEAAIVAGQDPSAYVRLIRRSVSELTGGLRLTLRWMLNNVIGGSNVSAAQAAAGLVTYRAIMLQAPAGAYVSNISAWIEARGVLAVAGNGLPGSGGGTLTFADISSWPVDVRYLRITTSTGTLREVVGGYRAGNSFVVIARGRLGTSATTGAAGDWCTPVPPIRLAREDAVSNAIQRVADETTAPTGRTWSTGVGAGNGVALGNLPVGGAVGLWLERSTFAGQLCDALMLSVIGLRYTVAGITYTQRLGGAYRVANDLTASRFQAFRSLGMDVPIDLAGVAVASSANRPFSVPLASSQVNNIAAVMVNDYGMQTEFARATIKVGAGGSLELLPPSAAEDLRLVAYGEFPPVVNANTVRVFAMYPAAVDGDARASHWIVHATDGSVEETKVVAMAGGDVEWLDTTLIAGGEFGLQSVITVVVRTSRSDNPADTSVQSTPISEQATMDTTVPAESEAVDVFLGGRAHSV